MKNPIDSIYVYLDDLVVGDEVYEDGEWVRKVIYKCDLHEYVVVLDEDFGDTISYYYDTGKQVIDGEGKARITILYRNGLNIKILPTKEKNKCLK